MVTLLRVSYLKEQKCITRPESLVFQGSNLREEKKGRAPSFKKKKTFHFPLSKIRLHFKAGWLPKGRAPFPMPHISYSLSLTRYSLKALKTVNGNIKKGGNKFIRAPY